MALTLWRSRATAIHRNRIVHITQNVVPATKLQDAVLKYCAYHADANATSTHVTKRHKKKTICETIDLQHVILITLRECHRMVRLSDPIAKMLRTVPNGCGRARKAGRTRLQPRDLNEYPSPWEKHKSCAMLFLLSASRCDMRKSLVSPEFKLLPRPSNWILVGPSRVELAVLLEVGILGCFPMQH